MSSAHCEAEMESISVGVQYEDTHSVDIQLETTNSMSDSEVLHDANEVSGSLAANASVKNNGDEEPEGETSKDELDAVEEDNNGLSKEIQVDSLDKEENGAEQNVTDKTEASTNDSECNEIRGSMVRSPKFDDLESEIIYPLTKKDFENATEYNENSDETNTENDEDDCKQIIEPTEIDDSKDDAGGLPTELETDPDASDFDNTIQVLKDDSSVETDEPVCKVSTEVKSGEICTDDDEHAAFLQNEALVEKEGTNYLKESRNQPEGSEDIADDTNFVENKSVDTNDSLDDTTNERKTASDKIVISDDLEGDTVECIDDSNDTVETDEIISADHKFTSVATELNVNDSQEKNDKIIEDIDQITDLKSDSDPESNANDNMYIDKINGEIELPSAIHETEEVDVVEKVTEDSDPQGIADVNGANLESADTAEEQLCDLQEDEKQEDPRIEKTNEEISDDGSSSISEDEVIDREKQKNEKNKNSDDSEDSTNKILQEIAKEEENTTVKKITVVETTKKCTTKKPLVSILKPITKRDTKMSTKTAAKPRTNSLTVQKTTEVDKKEKVSRPPNPVYTKKRISPAHQTSHPVTSSSSIPSGVSRPKPPVSRLNPRSNPVRQKSTEIPPKMPAPSSYYRRFSEPISDKKRVQFILEDANSFNSSSNESSDDSEEMGPHIVSFQEPRSIIVSEHSRLPIRKSSLPHQKGSETGPSIPVKQTQTSRARQTYTISVAEKERQERIEAETSYATPLQRKEAEVREIRRQLSEAYAMIELQEDNLERTVKEKQSGAVKKTTERSEVVEDLAVEVTKAQEEVDQLKMTLSKINEKHSSLEIVLQQLKEDTETKEKRHQEIYLEMYTKGKNSARFERQIELEKIAVEAPDKVCKAELIDRLSATQDELKRWQSLKLAEHYEESSLPDTDAKAQLSFMKDSMFHYLSEQKRETVNEHLNALVSMFSFSGVQMKHINKALEEKRRQGKL